MPPLTNTGSRSGESTSQTHINIKNMPERDMGSMDFFQFGNQNQIQEDETRKEYECEKVVSTTASQVDDISP
jgi:hypothetical protein